MPRNYLEREATRPVADSSFIRERNARDIRDFERLNRAWPGIRESRQQAGGVMLRLIY